MNEALFLTSYTPIATLQTVVFELTSLWEAPSGVTSVTVHCFGGGGSGGGGGSQSTYGSGGGAGGQYAAKVVSVTPGNVYTVTIGAGGAAVSGTAGNPGGDSWFSSSSTVIAKGGVGGQYNSDSGAPGGQGSTVGGIGDVVYRGGHGNEGGIFLSGGGGGGAGFSGSGGDASFDQGGAGTVPGGDGGYGTQLEDADGNSGITYGGGGGGARGQFSYSGAGANGAVVLTYMGY